MAAKFLSASGAAAALVAVLLLACASSAPSRPAASMTEAVSVEPAPSIEPVRSEPAPPSPEALAAKERADEKGWGYMVARLVADGIPLEPAARAFADPRMPTFDGLLFGLDPRESHAMYRHFLRGPSVLRAERCAALNAPALDAAERTHGVDASVLAAILHVETACGRNTGRSLVLHRLARLAMANEPHNVARNLGRWTDREGRLDPDLGERVRARARYLEGLFYPQVVATFEIARQKAFDPLDLRGSAAGAFGYPQFLPLNYIAFGTDGNGDGNVSLYEPEDAAASAARFLASYGWRPGMTREEEREVVWHYNRSDAYIDAVLGLADRIERSGVLRGANGEAADYATVGATEAPGPGAPATPAPEETPETRHP
jgi:membrane-bound lytic murein transglycosylase B